MTKLNQNPIGQSDIEEYLKDYSDFNFELRVLKQLRELKLVCQHSGTYDDPITNKSREFDIRALWEELPFRIHLSIECKNIQDNFPLVTHCLERTYNESYNDLIHTYEPFKYNDLSAVNSSSRVIRQESGHSLYLRGEYVAKSADQVGRDTKNVITATDGGVFDKISQAINSASDLISQAADIEIINNADLLTFVCSVLVVPDGKLWQIKYKDDGQMIGSPQQVNHVSYYIGKEWSVGKPFALTYKLSHLEIITFSEIKSFFNTYLSRLKDNLRFDYKRLIASR